MPEKFDFSKPEDQKKAEDLPKEERDRIEEEAHEEANLMKKMVETGYAKDYKHAERMKEGIQNFKENMWANREEYENILPYLDDEEKEKAKERFHDEALFQNRIKEEAQKKKNIVDSNVDISEIEKLLSPEIIEKIMGKLQDIDEKGINFHISVFSLAEGILRDGLLPGQQAKDYARPNNLDFQITMKEFFKKNK